MDECAHHPAAGSCVLMRLYCAPLLDLKGAVSSAARSHMLALAQAVLQAPSLPIAYEAIPPSCKWWSLWLCFFSLWVPIFEWAVWHMGFQPISASI